MIIDTSDRFYNSLVSFEFRRKRFYFQQTHMYLPLTPPFRIKCNFKSFANKVEGNYGDANCNKRKHCLQWIYLNDFARCICKRTPASERCGNANSQEAQPCFGKNCLWYHERNCHDDRSHCVYQKVLEEDAPRACSQHERRRCKFLLLQALHFLPHTTCNINPTSY